MSLRFKKVDWKFATGVVLSIIAIVTPVWLWRADLDARGLDMTLLGSFELISSVSESRQGLRILYDGKDVNDPFGSIIELSNSGAKPIQASDFDGSIEIEVAKPVKLLRSQIVRRVPQALEPVVSANKHILEIDPLLLNPGDKMSVEILTAGGKPQFVSRGRIAGIPDLKIQESPSTSSFRIQVGWAVLVAVSFGTIYAYYAGSQVFLQRMHSRSVYFLGTTCISLLSSALVSFIALVVLEVSSSMLD